MKRIRVTRPKIRDVRAWDEVLPLDPRDPDVCRAKAVRRSACAAPGVGEQVIVHASGADWPVGGGGGAGRLVGWGVDGIGSSRILDDPRRVDDRGAVRRQR
jgi:hypothetical protein